MAGRSGFTRRKRATLEPSFLGRIQNGARRSISRSNATSVPGMRQTATFGSPIEQNPPVTECLKRVVTRLSPTFAGREHGRISSLCPQRLVMLSFVKTDRKYNPNERGFARQNLHWPRNQRL